jgi:purine-binding chemotaxis protein CheW
MKKEDKKIDWEAVHASLERSEAAVLQSLAADSDRIQRTFAQRAHKLSARREEKRDVSMTEIQVFVLGEQAYAIPVAELSEIVAFKVCTPVPGAAQEYLGIVNLRGEIRAVVDLSRLLGLACSSDQSCGYILFTGRGKADIGLRVDRVDNIRRMDLKSHGGMTTGIADLQARYIRALTPEKIIVLSMEAIRLHPAFKQNANSTHP